MCFPCSLSFLEQKQVFKNCKPANDGRYLKILHEKNKKKKLGYVWFLFLKVFENTENIILMFFKNYSCYLDLVFFFYIFLFFSFYNEKKF